MRERERGKGQKKATDPDVSVNATRPSRAFFLSLFRHARVPEAFGRDPRPHGSHLTRHYLSLSISVFLTRMDTGAGLTTQEDHGTWRTARRGPAACARQRALGGLLFVNIDPLCLSDRP